MKLIKVKTAKLPGTVWLIFEDKSYLPYSVDDWVKNSLTLPADLSADLYLKLIDQSIYFRLKTYSLNQIALSPKIKKDLSIKLLLKSHIFFKKYQVTSPHLKEIITSVLEFLDKHHLLDESAYVDHILLRYSHKPRAYITRFLASKGLSNYKVEKDDSKLLKEILSKPKYQNIAQSDYKTRQKLIASLIRKGFTYEDIKDTI